MEKELIHLFQKKTNEGHAVSYKCLHETDWKLIPALRLHEKIRQEFIKTCHYLSVNDSDLPSNIEELKTYLDSKDQEALYVLNKSLPMKILDSVLKQFTSFDGHQQSLLALCLIIVVH